VLELCGDDLVRDRICRGFDQPATDRFGAMLGFVDVNEQAAGPNSLGRGASQPG